MGMNGCCSPEVENEYSEALSTLSNTIDSISRCVRNFLEGKVDEQEKMIARFFQNLGGKKDVKSMAAYALDVKGKLDMKKIEKQKMELDEEKAEEEMSYDVFSDLDLTDKTDEGKNTEMD